jgi:tetratricopeptide (TPR) repeat protein
MFKNTLIFEPDHELIQLSDEDKVWLTQKGVHISTDYDEAVSRLSTGQFLVIAVVSETLAGNTDRFLRTCQKNLGALPQWQILIGNTPAMELQLLCQELSVRTFWGITDVRKTFGPWILEQNRLVTDKTDEADRSLRIGVTLAQGKWDIIEKSLETLKQEADHDFRIAFNLGMYYEKKDRSDLALQFFSRSLGINSRFIPAIYRQAQALLETGKPGEALSAFQRLETINPRNPDRKALMAQAYADTGDWEKAKELKAAAVALEPDNPLARELDVRIAFESGDFSSALSALDKCSTTNDYFIRKLNAEAVKLSHNDQPDQAIQLYNKAWEIAPETMKFRISYNIALAHYRQGNFSEAMTYCDRADIECTDTSFDKIQKLRTVLNEKVA